MTANEPRVFVVEVSDGVDPGDFAEVARAVAEMGPGGAWGKGYAAVGAPARIVLGVVGGRDVATPHDFAQLAYEAYAQTAGWKNYQGLPMPQWRDLGESIQQAWVAAAGAAARATAE